MDDFLNIAMLIENNSDTYNIATDIDDDKLQEYLRSLNVFLYAYFLIKYQRDLKNIYIENNKKLDDCDKKMLQEIIDSYRQQTFKKIEYNENDIVDECIKIINENYNKKLTLEDIANEIHVSKNYLCCLFKKKTGYNFCKYLNILRVNKAKELISKNKTLDYISYECGFCSQAHFSTIFKKYTGKSPTEYKKTS
ncbi:MAG: AraC family transcriptional regulator [Tissierellia bacterium]|nr:AraC family transcriptional regulator [Tissierellia bacterium]